MERKLPDINNPFLPPEYIIELIKDHMLLNAMLKILTYDMEVMKRNKDLKMREVLVRNQQRMIDITLQQLTQNNRTLKEKPGMLKIVEMKITKGKAQCWYLYNKYEYDMMLQGDLMRAETLIRMAQMMGVDLTLPSVDEE